MTIEIDYVASPNHSSRRGHQVVASVVHYTAAGPAAGSIRWFQMPESQASAHYVIARDGDVTRMVKLTRKAWHAGNSELDYLGEMTSDANLFTIGFELANCGLLIDDGADIPSDYWYEIGRTLVPYNGPDPVKACLRYDNGHEVEGWWEPYSDEQLDAFQALLRHLKVIGYHDAAANLVGHEEIHMPFASKKRDPGPLFPWVRFSRKMKRRTAGYLL